MLCLHCSPPTSDPRGPEQREPHSLLTDTGESSEYPAHPTAPGQRDTQQAQSPQWSDCSWNDRAAHSSRRTRRAILTPCQRAENRQQRDSPPHDSQRRVHHLRPQQRPYAILRSTGTGSVLSRDPLARAARPSEPLVRLRARRLGPAASAEDEGLPEWHLGGSNSLNRLLCD